MTARLVRVLTAGAALPIFVLGFLAFVEGLITVFTHLERERL